MIYIALSIDAKVAELVDALASGVSVLTDVRVQVPLFAPRWRRNINQSNNIDCAKVAELVDALASGVSVLTDVRVQVLSSHQLMISPVVPSKNPNALMINTPKRGFAVSGVYAKLKFRLIAAVPPASAMQEGSSR